MAAQRYYRKERLNKDLFLRPIVVREEAYQALEAEVEANPTLEAMAKMVIMQGSEWNSILIYMARFRLIPFSCKKTEVRPNLIISGKVEEHSRLLNRMSRSVCACARNGALTATYQGSGCL